MSHNYHFLFVTKTLIFTLTLIQVYKTMLLTLCCVLYLQTLFIFLLQVWPLWSTSSQFTYLLLTIILLCLPMHLVSLDPTTKSYHIICVIPWLIPLSIMPSSSIRTVTSGKMFFLPVNNISLHMYIHIFFIHSCFIHWWTLRLAIVNNAAVNMGTQLSLL